MQARLRSHASQPSTPRRGTRPGQPIHVEFEYGRGALAYLAYLAAWDVRRGQISGRCAATTGKAPFTRLVDQLMRQEPYHSAPRVFWIVDKGSSHRGATAAGALTARYPNLVLVHLPTHASWLNQVELSFSIIQRKELTPNDFTGLIAVEHRLRAYEDQYNRTAQPFAWKFTRQDLARRLAQLNEPAPRDHTLARAA